VHPHEVVVRSSAARATLPACRNMTGFWLPPVAGGVCILAARAVSGDGLSRTVAAAILVPAGTPRLRRNLHHLFCEIGRKPRAE
jgi:hypothetical protein